MSVLIKGMDMPSGCDDCRLFFCQGGWYDDDKVEPYKVYICQAANEFFYDSHDDEVQPDITVRQDFCPLRDKLKVRSKPVKIVGAGFYDQNGNEIERWIGNFEGETFESKCVEEKRTNVENDKKH